MLSETRVLQEPVIHILKSQIEMQALAHTYLVTGRKEWGKQELVQDFVRSLQCEENHLFEDCECAACRKVTEGNHPDVMWIGLEEDTRSLKIEQVREMLSWVALRPYEGKWKCFVLYDADRLTIEAANALLKTLEEPPAQTIIFLLVEHKAQILETIQSRSFEVRLIPVREDEREVIDLPVGFKEVPWEEYLETAQAMKRDRMKNFLTQMMSAFRQRMVDLSAEGSGRHAEIGACVKAVEAIYTCKDAIEANANQKIALTRLAVKLNRAVPVS